MIRLVNQLITRAVETQASDIHIEPFEDRLRVRYRYDGVLHEAEAPPRRLAAAIISRIKIMAQAGHRRAAAAAGRPHQAGGARAGGRFPRLHRCPTLHGETVVLRILDRTAVAFDYAKPRAVRRRWSQQFGRRAGAAERHRAGDRPDRQRQDHDALYRPAGAQLGGPQDRHRRGPDRVPACAASTRSRSSRRSA